MGYAPGLLPMPKARKIQSFRFPALNGGLNLRDEEINLKDNESPETVNLWWDNGMLVSRPGQQEAASRWGVDSDSGNAFAAGDTPYAATAFREGVAVHIGASLYTWHGEFQELRRVDGGGDVAVTVPRKAGNFFQFGDDLFYKNEGGFYKLTYRQNHSASASPFTLSRVTDDAFTPTILINANPATGSGDIYQPENCLSPKKRVTYNASVTPSTVVRSGNGVSRAFSMGVTSALNLRGVASVYVNDAYTEPALYSFDVRTGSVIFNTAPPDNSTITFTLDIGNCEYHLPVDGVESVTEVRVDNITLTEGRDYSVDSGAGIVIFTNAPAVTNPPTNNSVEITYSKPNNAKMSEVMNCPYAAVCGTGTQLCIVAGGNPAQPNAVYWSGNTEYGFDPTYFPVSNYNLARDDITGFGNQYGQTIVFQKRRIGKLSVSLESVHGRDALSLTYTGVNDKTGCDLPHSIQLVENNLTFANTSGGVYRILSSSAAYENNIQCVSEKINGSDIHPGLLYDMRVAGVGPVCSLDDGKRYWLAVNNHIWLWDYSISGDANPVWFYFTDIAPLAFSMRNNEPCLFDGECRAVRLCGIFDDFGNPIRKVYQFPVRNFGRYDRLKDVLSVLFSVRADAPSDTRVIYETDYETRTDPVNLTTAGYDRLTERNLETRDLSVPRHAAVFQREPRCLNVRHFSMRLENNTAGKDLNLNFVEIQIRYAGRNR